jgi:hypothetical protein
MIILQSQPNRAYPYFALRSNERKVLLGCEFSNQLLFENKEEKEIAFKYRVDRMDPKLNDSLPSKYKDVESIKPQTFDAYPEGLSWEELIVEKGKIIDEDICWEPEKEIDYLMGIFSSKYLENYKKNNPNGDFSFTIMDHPIAQCCSFYFYLKSVFGKLRKTEEILKQNEGKAKLEITNQILDTFKNDKNFQDKMEMFEQRKLAIQKVEKFLNRKVTDFTTYFEGVRKYSLMLGLSNEAYGEINNLNEWIDFVLDKKWEVKSILKEITTPIKVNPVIIHCSELYHNHDLYGFMDTRENFDKTLKILKDAQPKVFPIFTGDSYFKWQPFAKPEHRIKELEKFFEKDIEFFEEKKKIFNDY